MKNKRFHIFVFASLVFAAAPYAKLQAAVKPSPTLTPKPTPAPTPKPVVLTSLTISGPSQANNGDKLNYLATATYSSGSSKGVKANWSISGNSLVSISPDGQLNVSNQNQADMLSVTASYTEKDVAKKTTINVKIASKLTRSAGQYTYFPNTTPKLSWGVPQQIAADLRKKYRPNDTSKDGWWFCGQASTMTAIDFLRDGKALSGKSLTRIDKVGQLEWLHLRLIETDAEYTVTNHYEATVQNLLKVMQTHKSDEFQSEKITRPGDTYGRQLFRNDLLDHLQKGVAIVLRHSQGHYVLVWKVDYQPQNGGGTVYYFDPLNGDGSMLSEPFAGFLDSLPSAMFYRYSAITVKKK